MNPPGGWAGRGTFNITFNSGGAIEFAEHFRQAVASGMPSTQSKLGNSGLYIFLNSFASVCFEKADNYSRNTI